MSDVTSSTTASPSLGVAKIVKLGPETLLVVDVKNGGEIPEGDVAVKSIEALPIDSEISGAGICEARISCTTACLVRIKATEDAVPE